MFDPSPIVAGDRRALARLLTHIENTDVEAAEALAWLFPHTGRAHLIGVTGAPGCGKSSLVNALALALRRAGSTVAILAVDPSSPYTGGALLGDRLRMRDLAGDPGVFIRSTASRGALGGLADTTADMAAAFDAAGYDKILIETVGAGQAEVDIASAAHTVLVIESPGLGDDVQAIKAGILEVADLLVVNKADQPNAANTVRALRASVEMMPAGAPWTPPILQTVATVSQGVPELAAAVEQHLAYLVSSGERQRRERKRLRYELSTRLRDLLLDQLMTRLGNGHFEAAVERIVARQWDPLSAARQLASETQTARQGPESRPEGGQK
jgi:LAO/AO transport system kinase